MQDVRHSHDCPDLASAFGRTMRAAGCVLLLAVPLSLSVLAQSAVPEAVPIKQRHMETPRNVATKLPRSEADQAIVDGWPLYRTERGQRAFNDAMATLKATEGPTPAAAAFRGCRELDCGLNVPTIGAEGWIPAGRLWLSPSEYVLFVRSPRQDEDTRYRRRSGKAMKYFVFHEFHNSSRNTDLYDTISSHSRHVFVPFYLSKQAIDAKGRRFVTIVQVAPYDVDSVHATNWGSAGPGVEVAKNGSDELEPLQGLAGIVLATIVKAAAPQLQVVNHHGSEGLEMLQGYERRLAGLRSRAGAAAVVLPFVHAQPQRMAAATARLKDLIAGPGAVAHGPHQAEDRSDAPALVGPVRLATRPGTMNAPPPTLIGPILPATRPGASAGAVLPR